VIPKDAEYRELTTLFNQLLPEPMRRYDNNNSSYESYKSILEQIKRRIPDEIENITNLL